MSHTDITSAQDAIEALDRQLQELIQRGEVPSSLSRVAEQQQQLIAPMLSATLSLMRGVVGVVSELEADADALLVRVVDLEAAQAALAARVAALEADQHNHSGGG